MRSRSSRCGGRTGPGLSSASSHRRRSIGTMGTTTPRSCSSRSSRRTRSSRVRDCRAPCTVKFGAPARAHTACGCVHRVPRGPGNSRSRQPAAEHGGKRPVSDSQICRRLRRDAVCYLRHHTVRLQLHLRGAAPRGSEAAHCQCASTPSLLFDYNVDRRVGGGRGSRCSVSALTPSVPTAKTVPFVL